MSFLAPLFLLGTAAVTLPIVFHLIRRSPRLERVFSSLMFLKPSTPRITRRSRLDQIPLLLLRCAILCLLALAFARPFWDTPVPETPPGEATAKSMLLLDVSASMQREGLWAEARGRVETFVARSAPGDEVAVYAFDQHLAPIVSFDEWNATPAGDRKAWVRARLRDVQPGWGGTALDQAVIHGAELLVEGEDTTAGIDREIVVVTDLQEGSRTSDLQGYEWPTGVRVRTECLSPRQPGNAGLEWLPGAAHGDSLAIRLKISNAPDSVAEQFQVGWVGSDEETFLAPPQEVYVPAGQSRVVTLDPVDTGGAAGAVRLTGDGEPFDNRAFVIPPERRLVNVLFIGPPSGDDARDLQYFLRRAFPDTARQEIRVGSLGSDDPPASGELDEAALIVATGAQGDPTLRLIREALEAGATALFVVDSIACARTLAGLTGREALPLTEVVAGDYAMLGDIDYRHPLFAPFADERFSDFTSIHFWRYRRIDASGVPGARVLARFDSEDPALIEVPVGRGRLFVLCSSWLPADSQLALSSKFVPLLFSLLELGGRATLPDPQRYVGDAMPSAAFVPAAATGVAEAPGGPGGAGEVGREEERRFNRPGIHRTEGSGAPHRLAVNLDPRESRTAPLPADELERMGAPGPGVAPDPVRTAQQQVTLHHADLEARQKMWRWLILIALAVVLVETGLAGWVDRRNPALGRAAA